MKDVVTMAGNCAADTIWDISVGTELIPRIGYLNTDGRQVTKHLFMSSIDAAAMGHNEINHLTDEHQGGTFINECIVTLESGKTGALIVDVKFRDELSKHIQFLIPYRDKKHEEGFAIHNFKLAKVLGFTYDDHTWIRDAFSDGIESHKHGNKL